MDKYIYDFMATTIEVARLNPKAPYGAILVYDDKDILLKSVNSAHNHPLMHGELSVIHELFTKGFDGNFDKLSLYTTAEPCPMCAAAVYWARIPKVVYGSSINTLHSLFGRQIQINSLEIFSQTPDFYKCDLIGNIMEAECNELFFQAKQLQE